MWDACTVQVRRHQDDPVQSCTVGSLLTGEINVKKSESGHIKKPEPKTEGIKIRSSLLKGIARPIDPEFNVGRRSVFSAAQDG